MTPAGPSDPLQSTAFKAFRAEFFERSDYMQWHDGINVSVVLALEGNERAEAEDMLIESLRGGGMWAANGLAALRSKKALPQLKEIARTRCGPVAVRAAEAIEIIEGSGEFVSVIIERLHHDGAWGTRIDAAMALRRFPRDDVVDALFTAMLDPDMLVRHHSAESLLAIHGLAPDISQHRDIYRLLVVDASAGEVTARESHEEAARMLKTLLAVTTPRG